MGKAHIVKNKFYSIFVVIVILIMSFFGFSIKISTQSYAEEIQSTISINVNFEHPELLDVVLENRTFTQILLPDCISQAMPGDPALPVYSSQILIPNGKDVIDVSVSYSDSIDIDCDIADKPIVPQQEMVPFSCNNRGHPFAMNEASYNKFTPVINTIYRDGGIGFCRGFAILTVYLYPVIYRPKTGELSYIPEMKISVELKGDEHSTLETNLEKRNDFLRYSDHDRRVIKDMVANPESISTYASSATGRLGEDAPLDGGGEPNGTDSPFGGGDSPLDYSGGFCDPADSYEYVIITNNALKDTTGYIYNWSDLIDHRQSYSGLAGTIVTVEEIDACVDYWNDTALFNDSQAHIREFCKDAYEDWGMEYLILGGTWQLYGSGASSDTRVVPFRMFTDRYEGYTYDTMPCDMYYNHIDGDWWYSDSGGMWGGGMNGANDKYAEFYIGRLAVSSDEDISNIVQKIIWYDNNNHNNDWLRTCCFTGGDLGWAVTSKQYMEELREGDGSFSEYVGFEEWSDIYPSYALNTSSCFYHADYGDAWKTPFKNELSNNTIAIINHIGHGSPSVIFNLKDLYWLHNSNFLMGYSQGCLQGRFEYGCQFQDWMNDYTDRGAYAIIVNTGYGYANSGGTFGASQHLNKIFWDYFFNNQSENFENWQLGKAQAHSKDIFSAFIDSYSHAWCYVWYSCHLFGDPAQTLRIGDANHMVVLSNENPSDGSNDVSIGISMLSVTMTDPEGNNFNWSIETSPDIGSSSANDASNGSKSCTISGLNYSTTYHWFVNVTNGNGWTNESFSFTTEDEPVNNSPVFSSQSINNGTTGVSIELPSLSITIQDPEGDSFNWTIETSPNIGSNSGNGESNGSKSCSISGLGYFTTYTWYVNATDGNSWTREWYTFTTRSTYTPDAPGSFSAGANGRFQIDLSWTDDTKTDSTRVEWHISSDASWNIGDHVLLYNGSSESVSQSGLNPGTSRYYKAWSWNETDKIWSSGVTDDATTVSNSAPSIGSPSPGNGSIDQELSLTWSISVTDADSDTFDWSIDCSNGQSSSANGDTDGTKQLSISGLNYATTYTVWVNATDSYDSVSEWFTFTTRNQLGPDAPSGFAAVADGRFEIDLSWTDDTEADSTLVEWSASADPAWSVGDHTELYNGSAEMVSHSGLAPGTQRFYKAWSWNATDSVWSAGVTDDATTDSNNPPSYGTPSPANGSIDQELSLTWSISVTDADVDIFDWGIECSNGQTNSGTDDSDGIKQLSISGLDYSSIYTVWVNTTDSFDWTRDWFTFETASAGDTSPPLISDVAIASSSPMDTMAEVGWENITCSVTDNSAVSSVFLNITHPDGSTTNVSMNNVISTDVYYYNTSFLQSGNYSYFIWSNDTSDNSNKSSTYDFSLAPNWDVNKDGYCNVLDINLISNHYSESGSAGWIREDIDNNGEIQILDFVFVSDHYGESWWV